MSEQLKDIIDQAENVQDRLKRMNNHIRELDVSVDHMMKEVKEKSLIYCKNQRQLSRDAKIKAVKEIRTLHDGIIEKSSKKEKIASDMYEFIDKKIQKLDDNMRVFNNEMKEKTIKEASRMKGNMMSTSGGRGDKKKKGEDKKTRLQDTAHLEYKPLQLEAMDMPVNPNEPRYCTCHQVSFGEMIACDNPGCKYEWFHYQCLGITEAPPGEFICRYCKAAKAEKKKK